MQIIRTLQESERFKVEEVLVDGNRAVLKTAKSSEMKQNIIQELQAYEVYTALSKNTDCPFTVGTILDATDDSLLISYLEGDSMADIINDSSKEQHYKSIVNIMAFCDRKIAETNLSAKMQFSPAEELKQNQRTKDMLDSIKMLPTEYLVLKKKIFEVAEYYNKNSKDLLRCFVNADLTPQHVMVSKGKPAIFDFENAKLNGPRFSDVINLCTRLWFIEDNTKIAKSTLETYFKIINQPMSNFSTQVKALIYRRCLGFTYELLTTPNQYHNTELDLTQFYAQNILDVIAWADEM